MSCHAGRQEVGECDTRSESQRTCYTVPPPSVNKVAHCGFETQRKYKTGLSVALQEGLMSSINEKIKKKEMIPIN